MAIHVPGYRTARKKRASSAKRNVVAVLSLTAMVDMFTVLAVFLLQNYRTTGEVVEINDDVTLPNATQVKELMPSNVVTISTEEVTFNESVVAEYKDVKAQQDWLVPRLEVEVKKLIEAGEREKKNIANRIKKAVADVNAPEDKLEEVDKFRKITIQADKEVDFATLKKIMYTVTEAGIYEINFAVIKKEAAESTGI